MRFALKSKIKTRRNLQWSSMLLQRLIVYWAKIVEVAMIHSYWRNDAQI